MEKPASAIEQQMSDIPYGMACVGIRPAVSIRPGWPPRPIETVDIMELKPPYLVSKNTGLRTYAIIQSTVLEKDR